MAKKQLINWRNPWRKPPGLKKRKKRRGKVFYEEIQAELLEDLEAITGISFADIMASQFETREGPEPAPVFRTGEIDDVDIEDTIEDDLDMDNDSGSDFSEYLDDLMENSEIDTADNDAYAETDV